MLDQVQIMVATILGKPLFQFLLADPQNNLQQILEFEFSYVPRKTTS